MKDVIGGRLGSCFQRCDVFLTGALVFKFHERTDISYPYTTAISTRMKQVRVKDQDWYSQSPQTSMLSYGRVAYALRRVFLPTLCCQDRFTSLHHSSLLILPQDVVQPIHTRNHNYLRRRLTTAGRH